VPLTDMGRPSSITSLARPMAPLSSDESVFALHASADLPFLHSAPLGFAINCQIWRFALARWRAVRHPRPSPRLL